MPSPRPVTDIARCGVDVQVPDIRLTIVGRNGDRRCLGQHVAFAEHLIENLDAPQQSTQSLVPKARVPRRITESQRRSRRVDLAVSRRHGRLDHIGVRKRRQTIIEDQCFGAIGIPSDTQGLRIPLVLHNELWRARARSRNIATIVGRNFPVVRRSSVTGKYAAFFRSRLSRSRVFPVQRTGIEDATTKRQGPATIG